MSESILDKCSQSSLFEFEGFIVRPFDGWHLWMENPQGEGMQIKKVVFLGTLIKLFEENF